MTDPKARANQSRLFRTILKRAPLETDARAELTHLIRILETDNTVTMQGDDHHLYPFITHTLSATQTILLKHLNPFKGPLLSEAYQASHGTWDGPHDSDDEYDVYLDTTIEKIEAVVRGLGVEKLNGPQIAFTLMLSGFHMLENPIAAGSLLRKRGSPLSAMIDDLCQHWSSMWEDNGISQRSLIKLSRDLLSYNGTDPMSPQEVASRFSLTFSVDEKGLRIRPIERWGIQQIAESQGSLGAFSELWIPNEMIIRPDELSEFEDLLISSSATESDWQRFLNSHPRFLYILGDYDEHCREVRLSHQVVLDDCKDPDLRPDFLLRRIDLDVWDLLEIKLPNTSMAVGRKSRRRLSSAVSEAVAQLQQYREFFRDKNNTEWFRERYGFKASYPRLNLIVGRDSSFDSIDEKIRLTAESDISIFTYDDLHRIAKHSRLTTP